MIFFEYFLKDFFKMKTTHSSPFRYIYLLTYFIVFSLVGCNPAKTKLGNEFFGALSISPNKSTLSVSNYHVA